MTRPRVDFLCAEYLIGDQEAYSTRWQLVWAFRHGFTKMVSFATIIFHSVRKTDPRKFWLKLKEILPDKINSNKFNLVDQMTRQKIDVTDTANYINRFFSEVGPKLAEKLKESDWQNTMDPVHSTFNLNPTNSDDVRKLVKQICLFKASGIDHLSTKVLKDAFLILTDQITYMFNLSLGNGTFPDAWKRATIIPLQKEGNTDDVNNLRPISLLPLPGKLIKKIVHGQIINYLEDNKLLTDCQAGFRASHSTISKIAEVTDDIYK